MGEEAGGFTLDEALTTLGFGRFQALALAFAGFGWISDAMEMMLLSFIGPALQIEWNLSPSQESFLSTIVFLGMLVGAYFWGFISDVHGRRIGIIGADALIAISGIASALAPNYKVLVASRCFLGMGIGGAHIFASWFLEYIPTANRGSWMVAISAFWTLGSILEASLAWIVMPRLGWRWLLGFSSIPSLMVLVIIVSGIVPESPRFLCSKGRFTEARRILDKVAKLNRTAVPDGVLLSDHMTTESNEENAPSGGAPDPSTKKSSSHTNTYLKSLAQLFSSALLKTTILVWFLYFAFTFSYYGIVLITTELSSGHNTCGTVTSTHSNLYVKTFITSTAELPGLIIVATIVEKIGRKKTMQAMTVCTFAAMLPLMWRQNGITTTALLFLARMFISAGFSIANVYSKEVYPTSARTTGDGLANSMGRIGGMLCPLVSVGLVRDCHQTAAVGLFGAILLIAGLCIFLFPYETKGRNLADGSADNQ